MPEVVHGIDSLRPEHGPLLLVVGVFDGLHRGHLYLLRELRRAARRMGAQPAVCTFDHHPDEILAGAAPPLLCDQDERVARLERAGVAIVIVQHFDDTLRRTSYTDFVAAIQVRTALAGFLMTPDAAFGHQRQGTPQTLAVLGRETGFEVVVVPPFDLDGRAVRSTEVRAAIAAGDLAHARALLGRRVAVTGTVGDDGRLEFDLPVALPPAGRYDVTMELPILPGGARGASSWATAAVADGGLHLLARGFRQPAPGSRVRVAFVRAHKA